MMKPECILIEGPNGSFTVEMRKSGCTTETKSRARQIELAFAHPNATDAELHKMLNVSSRSVPICKAGSDRRTPREQRAAKPLQNRSVNFS
jgi:hypothetical protein